MNFTTIDHLYSTLKLGKRTKIRFQLIVYLNSTGTDNLISSSQIRVIYACECAGYTNEFGFDVGQCCSAFFFFLWITRVWVPGAPSWRLVGAVRSGGEADSRRWGRLNKK